MKQKNQGKSIFILIGMVLATFLLVFHNYSIKDVLETLKEANLLWILLAIGMIFVHMCGGGLALKVLLKSLHRDITFLQGAKYMAIEFYFSGITPSASGGEPMQIYYMSKDGIEVSRGTSAKMLITVLYKAVLLVLGLFVLLFAMPVALKTEILNVWIWMVFLLGFLVNLIVIVVCLLAMFRQSTLRRLSDKVVLFIQKKTRIRLTESMVAKYEHFLNDMKRSAEHFTHHRKETALAAVIILVQRMGLFSIPYLVYLAIGLGGENYLTFLAIQVVLSIAADSLPLPGGVGASEAILLALYEPIYSEQMLATAMLLSRFVSYYLYLFIAAGITITNSYLVAKRPKIVEEEPKVGNVTENEQ
ncbi:MAG: flippase-like domain-containing protein [Lachnospiraceae bacterium]|nr:flippase-like domain-containing protein [Lachnospiraceae bacterium]